MGGDGTIGGGKGSCRFKFTINGSPRSWVDHDAPEQFNVLIKHPDLPGGKKSLHVTANQKVRISWKSEKRSRKKR